MYFLQITKFLVGHLREDVGLFPIFTVGLPASIIGSAIKSSVCESYLRVSCMWAFFSHEHSAIVTRTLVFLFILEEVLGTSKYF